MGLFTALFEFAAYGFLLFAVLFLGSALLSGAFGVLGTLVIFGLLVWMFMAIFE